MPKDSPSRCPPPDLERSLLKSELPLRTSPGMLERLGFNPSSSLGVGAGLSSGLSRGDYTHSSAAAAHNEMATRLQDRIQELEQKLDPVVLRECLESMVEENRRLGEENNRLSEQLAEERGKNDQLTERLISLAELTARAALDKINSGG